MKKPNRRRKPKRKRPAHGRQEVQKLNKAVREGYVDQGSHLGHQDDLGWSDSLKPQSAQRRQKRRPQQRRGNNPRGNNSRGNSSPGNVADNTASRWGVVVGLSSGSCQVDDDGQLLRCQLPSRLARDQQQAVAIGDEVLLERQGKNSLRVRDVLPRRTILSRPDPHNAHRERVIAANIDVVVLVVSLVDPPLRPALVDRYLIAVERSGAEAFLCVNKVDLVEDEEALADEFAVLEPYRPLVRRVIPCSTVSGEGLPELRQALERQTAVFVGHSGVGKSSLINALSPNLKLRTGQVSHAHGKGRHTTSRSNLFHLGHGIRLIDTPGIREFGLWRLSPAELATYFPDFDEAAEDCRFGDCTHTHEPECAVRVAVEEGVVSPDRFDTYQRILESLAEERAQASNRRGSSGGRRGRGRPEDDDQDQREEAAAENPEQPKRSRRRRPPRRSGGGGSRKARSEAPPAESAEDA